jgi:epoxyqueuosine reductase
MRRINYQQLADNIKLWTKKLGFQQVGITDVDLSTHKPHLKQWLQNNYQAEMDYMAKNYQKRLNPALLVPNTIRVISITINYLTEPSHASFQQKPEPNNPSSTTMSFQRKLESSDTKKAYIANYAQGRDYHKLIRHRLQKLADMIEKITGPFNYRAFTDSAPVSEKALAEKAGLGWIGKNTILINKIHGSFFFLGELYLDLPLPIDQPATKHCGTCTKCIKACPTKAITAPYQLNAARCISYLTIEHKGLIPKKLRPLIGNKIFGCDDCQLCCPWNKQAKPTTEEAFKPSKQLNSTDLITLFNWSEAEFHAKTKGSAIKRIGYKCWLRNIAIALGNIHPKTPAIIKALQEKSNHPSELVREHVNWATNIH